MSEGQEGYCGHTISKIIHVFFTKMKYNMVIEMSLFDDVIAFNFQSM